MYLDLVKWQIIREQTTEVKNNNYINQTIPNVGKCSEQTLLSSSEETVH